MDFTGRSVMITGAGKGIGRDTARLLAARGAEGVALSRTAADLDSLAQEIGCRTLAVDLADADASRAWSDPAHPGRSRTPFALIAVARKADGGLELRVGS